MLTKWQKAKSEAVWRKDDLDGMSESFLILNQYFFTLAKESKKLTRIPSILA